MHWFNINSSLLNELPYDTFFICGFLAQIRADIDITLLDYSLENLKQIYDKPGFKVLK